MILRAKMFGLMDGSNHSACAKDNNQDGVFTIDELIQWINEHKLLKLVKEGLDADIDLIMEKQSSAPQKQEIASVEKFEK
jgi:hypothetical protein